MTDAQFGDMTDLEMTKLCAEALFGSCVVRGSRVYVENGRTFAPLRRAADAMELWKRLGLSCDRTERIPPEIVGDFEKFDAFMTRPPEEHDWQWSVHCAGRTHTRDADLNRAMVKCVAMQRALVSVPGKSQDNAQVK